MYENKKNFFRESRLGCYFALDLTYKTSLSYTSLLSSIQYTKNYEEVKAAQEQRKKNGVIGKKKWKIKLIKKKKE